MIGVYKEKMGNIIKSGLQGEFDVIAHGCNCFCTMGAGLAPQMAAAFKCNTFPLEQQEHRGDVNKLGCIDYDAIRMCMRKMNIQWNAYWLTSNWSRFSLWKLAENKKHNN